MGEEVVGTARSVESELAEKLNLRRLDTTDKEATNETIFNYLPKNILHFAGIAIPKEISENPEKGRQINIDSVFNLLDAVEYAKSRNSSYNPTIIVAGSVEQFGDPQYYGQVFDEKSERNPINEYGKQKEEMAVKFLRRCSLKGHRGYIAIQGQASGVSASGLISQDSGYFIPDIASQVAEIEASGRDHGVLITGIVSQQRNIVDVNDAIRGYLSLAEKTPAIGEYLVCASKSQPLEDVLKILIKYSSVEIIHEIDKARGNGGLDRFYSHNKLTVATGWNPEKELDETIKRVLEFQRLKVR
jgi:nucleoside-diphosphate-sugar epimerase